MYYLLYNVHQNFWSQYPLDDADCKGGHAQVYANVLYARFGFHPTSIYIEEAVLSESGKVDRTILHISFHDGEGQLRLLPPGQCRAFRFNATLMATSMVASIELISQPSYMSSV